jgi:uncharacterized membrane protein
MMYGRNPKMSVSAARKKLVAFIVLGILLVALALALPSLATRFHFGSARFATRTEWRVMALGLMLIILPAYVLFKFRNEKDEPAIQANKEPR